MAPECTKLGFSQVLTEYSDSELDTVLGFTESMNHHLTAAVVSNDVLFLGKVFSLSSFYQPTLFK